MRAAYDDPMAQLRQNSRDPMAQLRQNSRDPMAQLRQNSRGSMAQPSQNSRDPMAQLRQNSRSSMAQLRQNSRDPMAQLRQNSRDPMAQLRHHGCGWRWLALAWGGQGYGVCLRLKPQLRTLAASCAPALGPVAGLPMTTPMRVRPLRIASKRRQCRATSV